MRCTKHIVLILLVGMGIVWGAAATTALAQDGPTPPPLATLVSPTLVPPAPTAAPFTPVSISALARIRQREPQTLVVGIPFNLKPFASITETGDVEGFEADIARAIAEDWGAVISFRHVTSLNGHDLLRAGEIDLLLGQQLISRDAPDYLDFSDPIFMGRQVALAMADNAVNSILELSGQVVGVVIDSPGEEAFARWAAANGMPVQTARFVMLDDAFRALGEGQITALVGDRWELDRRVRGQIEGVKLLAGAPGEREGTFRTEPYGIAMLRHDENLRTLVNRTLQRLVASDRFRPIYDRWFPEGLMPVSDRVFPRTWRDLDADTRTLNDFPVDIVRPARAVIDRLRGGEPLRVAGLGLPPGPNGQPSPLERFNTALVYEMARRWGASVMVIPPSTLPTEDILASGSADLAVGLEPRWGPVDRIDYAGIYAERGYRMLVRVGSNIQSFAGLRTGGRRTIATFTDDPEAFEIARRLAISVGLPEATIQSVPVRDEQAAIQAVYELQTARVLFGDSLRVIPLANANQQRVQLTETFYNRRPLAFGVPRNDVTFRLLVDETLQDMFRDGTYQRMWQEHWNQGEPLTIIVWPGDSNPLAATPEG